jgi:aspartate aminotransferase
MCAKDENCSRSLTAPSEYCPSHVHVLSDFGSTQELTRDNSQGFASGNLDEDAWALRHFAFRGSMELAVAQSFSKNMGLYGERVGALHLLTGSPDAAGKVKGHILRLQRGLISQPPKRGATIAATILKDTTLFQKWLADLCEMSSRIKCMRQALYDELISLGTPGNWDHILTQVRQPYHYSQLRDP